MLSLMTTIWFQSTMFGKGEQGDAHAFLMFVLNQLDEIAFLLDDQPLRVRKAFYVENLQKVECKEGHMSQTTDKTLITINLSYEQNFIQCLKKYFKKESFSSCVCGILRDGSKNHGSNTECTAYFCNQCNEFTAATKTNQTRVLPDVLIINCNPIWQRLKNGEVNEIVQKNS
jgi:uncharacterized UBP type Zn finger protein